MPEITEARVFSSSLEQLKKTLQEITGSNAVEGSALNLILGLQKGKYPFSRVQKVQDIYSTCMRDTAIPEEGRKVINRELSAFVDGVNYALQHAKISIE